MIEVRMTNDDPICSLDRLDGEADGRRAWDTINIGVKEDNEVVDCESERCAPEPVESCRHCALLFFAAASDYCFLSFSVKYFLNFATLGTMTYWQ